MHYLITGGTGFIGRALCRELIKRGQVTVLTRSRKRAQEMLRPEVGEVERLDELRGLPPSAIVNLAGAGLADRRWSEARRKEIVKSRVNLTRRLVSWIGQQEIKPSVLVSMSAIGWYGSRGDEALTENSPPGSGFQSELCAAWEAEATKAEALGVRVVCLRSGVVLGREGGALEKMLPSFRMGLGATLGDGRHWLSWVHRDDLVGLIQWCLFHAEARGAYNATAPNAVSYEEFARTVAAVLHRRVRLRLSPAMLKLMFGEMADLLLSSQRVLPQRLQEARFIFRHPELRGALEHLLT